MFTKFLQIILAALALTAASGTVTSAWAQSVTVIEYYNKTLDAYFITGRTQEQQQLDAVADFQLTGMTFQAVAASGNTTGLTRVCRFYVNNASPYANSHFYGLENTDCELLLAQNLPGFNWEGYDFAVKQPASGACPSGTTTIYRSFRPAAGGKTANHRYSASAASYSASASVGYNAEQAAFCATAATDISVVTSADCGTVYYSGARISYESLNNRGLKNSWIRFTEAQSVVFNGRTARPVTEQYASGQITRLMIEDSPTSWADLGAKTTNAPNSLDSAYVQPTSYPRQMAIGETVSFDRYLAFSPIQNSGSPLEVGNVTLISVEIVTVPSGTYAACKFGSQISSQYYATGRTDLRRMTSWVAPGVGLVKSKLEETTYDDTGEKPTVTTEVIAVSVQRI